MRTTIDKAPGSAELVAEMAKAAELVVPVVYKFSSSCSACCLISFSSSVSRSSSSSS